MSDVMDERYKKLLEDLEDVVSQLAQQTDSRTTNLQVYIENLVFDAEKRAKRRWAWLVGIAASAIIALLIIGFEVWERQYERVVGAQNNVTKIEQQLQYIKDDMVKKLDLQEKISAKDKELQQTLETLTKALEAKDREFDMALERLKNELKSTGKK